MNNGQPIRLMWYIFIVLFFRILALENIAKILTTGPRLVITKTCQYILVISLVKKIYLSAQFQYLIFQRNPRGQGCV